jgi:argininosuccinate lyase
MNLMLQKASWNTKNMAAALKSDFSNATDLADDLVEKGLSFREAHEVIGRLVNFCIKRDKGLEDLTLAELQEFHQLFDVKSFSKVPHAKVLAARTSAGGTAPAAVLIQLQQARKTLG